MRDFVFANNILSPPPLQAGLISVGACNRPQTMVNQGRALPMGIEHMTLESKPRELTVLPTLEGTIVRYWK